MILRQNQKKIALIKGYSEKIRFKGEMKRGKRWNDMWFFGSLKNE